MLNTILHGNCLEKLKALPDNSVDAIVTDPPAGISFMGKEWDDMGDIQNFQEFIYEVFTEAKRVLKPGGHALVWAIPRTSHHTAMGIERAGFEIRDCVYHVFGSGFPKSLNIGKAVDKLQGNEREVIGKIAQPGSTNTRIAMGNGWQEEPDLTKGTSEWEGWGTALKPAVECWWLCRKPLEKGLSVAENCLKWGVGGIAIDACRVPTSYAEHEDDDNNAYKDLCRKDVRKNHKQSIDHRDESVSELLCQNDQTSTQTLDVQSLKKSLNYQDGCLIYCGLCDEHSPLSKEGDQVSVPLQNDVHKYHDHSFCIKHGNHDLSNSYTKSINIDRISQGRFPANLIHDGSEEVVSMFPNTKSGKYKEPNARPRHGHKLTESNGISNAPDNYGDSGSAARFFYTAKASKRERNMGCDELEEKQTVGGGGGIGNYLDDVNSASGKYGSEKAPSKNFHPTVKPIALMEYLVKLISKENHIVLDPFAGSGSTLIACKKLGRNFIGIEREEEYIKIAEARLSVV